ncbi:MAG: metallophosphoesterase [Hyphomonadaceae bacterium]|nr:metallophosphoesterase [Hyphomonadaceae bacterium]
MLTIAHLSDIHFGDACPRALAAARNALNALAPACIVVTGDITQAGRRREYAAAANWFAEINAPIVGCPGNHDAPVYALHERLIQPYKRFAQLRMLKTWGDAGGRAAVTTFNSARALQWRVDWSQGVYARDQVAGALEAAEAIAPRGWLIVGCHHPPETPPNARVAARTRHGIAGLEALGATPKTIVLSGHVHAYSAIARGEALFVTAPSLASSRARGDGLGFVVLTLNDHKATPSRWILGRDGYRPTETPPPRQASQAFRVRETLT